VISSYPLVVSSYSWRPHRRW